MASESDKVDTSKLWAAAAASVENEDRGSGGSEIRDAVAAQVEALANVDRDLVTYVAKTNTSGYRNQVWQGHGNTRANDIMVLVDTSGNESGIAAEARGRLNPRARNGFDAVVICEPDGEEWSVRSVIEYQHGSLASKIAELSTSPVEVIRVADPAMGAATRTPFDKISAPSAINAETIYDHLLEAKNVVLTGPPGTGKTRLALEVADLISGGKAAEGRLEAVMAGAGSIASVPAANIREPSLVWDMVQMHPAFGYEEFVRGLRTDPTQKGFSLVSVDGILPTICQAAALRGSKPTLLIIDEINRSNISAVLGETIFAIDPGQRGRPVRLQYEASDGGGDSLIVPPNLLVLCTMNTADRSIAMVDFAIRRRFRFVSARPSADAITSYYESVPKRGLIAISIMDAINSLLSDADIHVGHSYFMAGTGDDADTTWGISLAEKLAHEVRPLLREYLTEGKLTGFPSIAIGGHQIDLGAVSPAELAERLAAAIGGTTSS